MKKVLTKLAWIGLIVFVVFAGLVTFFFFPIYLPSWIYYACRIAMFTLAIVALVMIAKRKKKSKVSDDSDVSEETEPKKKAKEPKVKRPKRTRTAFGTFVKNNWARLLAILLIVVFIVLAILAAIFCKKLLVVAFIALWSAIAWFLCMIRPTWKRVVAIISMILALALTVLAAIFCHMLFFVALIALWSTITWFVWMIRPTFLKTCLVILVILVILGGVYFIGAWFEARGGNYPDVVDKLTVNQLEVSGNANIGGNVNVSHDVNVSEDVNVGGDVNVSEDVNVSGDVNVGGDVNVSEDVNVGGDVNISEDVNEEPDESEPEEFIPNEESSEPEHTHKYSEKVVEPTCTAKGYTKYTCECGDSYTADNKEALGHDYEEKVVEPTTTAQGYTVYTCKRCDDSYKDNYTEKLPVPKNPTISVSTDYMVKGDTVIVTLKDAEVSDVVIKYVDPNTGDWVEGGATLKDMGNGQYRLIVDDELWTMSVDLTIGLKGQNNYHLVTLEPYFE